MASDSNGVTRKCDNLPNTQDWTAPSHLDPLRIRLKSCRIPASAASTQLRIGNREEGELCAAESEARNDIVAQLLRRIAFGDERQRLKTELGKLREMLDQLHRLEDDGHTVHRTSPHRRLMKRTILIVDADPQIRSFCRTALEKSGCVVREARNGKQALVAVERTAFDLIVLDLCMPKMEGVEFLKAVHAKLPKFKIIGLSGLLDGAMLEAANLYGTVATLTKPFSPDTLLSVVSTVLAQ